MTKCLFCEKEYVGELIKHLKKCSEYVSLHIKLIDVINSNNKCNHCFDYNYRKAKTFASEDSRKTSLRSHSKMCKYQISNHKDIDEYNHFICKRDICIWCKLFNEHVDSNILYKKQDFPNKRILKHTQSCINKIKFETIKNVINNNKIDHFIDMPDKVNESSIVNIVVNGNSNTTTIGNIIINPVVNINIPCTKSSDSSEDINLDIMNPYKHECWDDVILLNKIKYRKAEEIINTFDVSLFEYVKLIIKNIQTPYLATSLFIDHNSKNYECLYSQNDLNDACNLIIDMININYQNNQKNQNFFMSSPNKNSISFKEDNYNEWKKINSMNFIIKITTQMREMISIICYVLFPENVSDIFVKTNEVTLNRDVTLHLKKCNYLMCNIHKNHLDKMYETIQDYLYNSIYNKKIRNAYLNTY